VAKYKLGLLEMMLAKGVGYNIMFAGGRLYDESAPRCAGSGDNGISISISNGQDRERSTQGRGNHNRRTN